MSVAVSGSDVLLSRALQGAASGQQRALGPMNVRQHKNSLKQVSL